MAPSTSGGGRKWLDQWPHRRRVWFYLLLLRLFFAVFQAWREESDARRLADKKVAESLQRPSTPSRDPDGLYQFDQLVATTVGGRIDRGNSLFTFQAIKSAGNLDAQREVEYRDFVTASMPSTWSRSTVRTCAAIRGKSAARH
jgi:hypothetical protein